MKSDSQNSKAASPQSMRAGLNSPNVPRPVVIGFVVALLVVGAFSVYRFMSPEAAPAISSAAQASNPDMDWLNKKVNQTGADYNRLSAEERIRAEEIAQKNAGISAKSFFSITVNASASSRQPVEREMANAATLAMRGGQQ